MKKTLIALTIAGLVSSYSIHAQSVQDGVRDLYAERYKSAKSIFEKLVAANPNSIDAIYWLGQTHIEMDDVAGAKAVYDKALMASANAPLLQVGRGQVDLLENKLSEARQRFETAITMTRGKKGDDPVILNAVGRAITSSYDVKEKKGGDITYAREKLEAAAQKDPKNAEIFVNLGDAIRKEKPGEGGEILGRLEMVGAVVRFIDRECAPYQRLRLLEAPSVNENLGEGVQSDCHLGMAGAMLGFFDFQRAPHLRLIFDDRRFVRHGRVALR